MRADGTSSKPSAVSTSFRRALVSAIDGKLEAGGWTCTRKELLHHGVAMTEPSAILAEALTVAATRTIESNASISAGWAGF